MPGRSVVEEMLAFARSRNATRVVVGKSRRSRWFELRHGSVVDELVRSGSGLADRGGAVGRRGRARPADRLAVRRAADAVGPYLEGVLTTAVATALGVLIDATSSLPNISLVFVVPVLVAAARHGLVPSLWVVGPARALLTTSSSCRRSTNSPSPIPPTSWRCSSSCSWRSRPARSQRARRSQTEAARREARTTAELYAFSRKIAGVMDLYDLLWIVVTHLARLLNAEVVILMPEEAAGDRQARCRAPPFRPTATSARPTSPRRAGRGMPTSPTGRGTDTLPGGRWLFVPIRTSRSPVGVIGVLPLKARPRAQRRRAPAARGRRQPGGRRHRAR